MHWHIKFITQTEAYKTTYNFNRLYNPEGKQTKMVTTITTNGTPTTATVETVYPNCK